ncbi:MAG TPA: ABC transporter permease [Oceanithermus profundus]|uniref:Cell division protein FtsX n=1 Tax=Oceanithermus profundus TaxID=187137 RepID=A0A7C4ZDH6_9DEIN|nr:ABC transporter permease [Oceanithermus profundus]
MYALAQALRAFRRHPTSALATLTTATVSFSLLFLVGLLLWNLDRVVSSLESEIEIVAYLKDGADADAVLREVRAWPEVESVQLIGRDEALALLQLEYPYLAEAADLIDNPLPDTLKVRLVDPSLTRPVARKLGALPAIGAGNVDYGGEVTERLVRFLAGLRLGANVLILLLIVDTFFSVMGTIRLSIENRREELRVMLLVGATRGFVQRPFLLEGLLLTVTAALVALALGNLAYRFVAATLQNLLPFLPVLSPDDLLRASFGLLALAIFLGFFGAWLSVRAYLRDTETP